jgi:hypothetical protein
MKNSIDDQSTYATACPGVLNQRPQPHSGRKDPLRSLGLGARSLGLERPQHSTVATVTSHRELDLAHLVAGMPKLSEVFELWVPLTHVIKSFSLRAQGTLFGARPIDVLTL